MISVVLPTHNGAHRLAAALTSIEAAQAAYAGESELVVVANGCTDGTAELVRRDFPKARLVELSPNAGFGGGVRAGVAQAQGDLVAVLSDDLRLEGDVLGPLAAPFADPDLFSTMPRILDAAGTKLDIPPYYPTVRLGQLKLKKLEATDRPAPCFFTAGGIALYRRSMFDALGGFSQLYHPGYHEDVDICWRAWARGWSSRYEPAAVVYHDHGQGAFATLYGKTQLRAAKRRNWFLVNLVHLDRGALAQVLWFLLRTLRRDLLRPSRLIAVLAAVPAILARLPAALAERRAQRAARRHDNAAVFARIPPA